MKTGLAPKILTLKYIKWFYFHVLALIEATLLMYGKLVDHKANDNNFHVSKKPNKYSFIFFTLFWKSTLGQKEITVFKI